MRGRRRRRWSKRSSSSRAVLSDLGQIGGAPPDAVAFVPREHERWSDSGSELGGVVGEILGNVGQVKHVRQVQVGKVVQVRAVEEVLNGGIEVVVRLAEAAKEFLIPALPC